MRDKISVSPGVYFLLPAAALLLPLRWVLAWVLAVAVHELGHYLALKLCRVPVLRSRPQASVWQRGSCGGEKPSFAPLPGPWQALA